MPKQSKQGILLSCLKTDNKIEDCIITTKHNEFNGNDKKLIDYLKFKFDLDEQNENLIQTPSVRPTPYRCPTTLPPFIWPSVRAVARAPSAAPT